MKTKLLFAIVFFPIIIFGQINGYFPLDSGNYWIYNNQPNSRVEVGGNLLINNKVYKIIIFGSSNLDTCYYRIEGSKIFSFKFQTSKEWLLYNFSLLKDSIIYSDSDFVYKCYNSNIELYQGRNLRKWMFGYHYPGMMDRDTYEIVVDSVGVVEYGGGIGFFNKLSQASINGKIFIITNIAIESDNIHSLLQINIYPNPFNSSTIILYSVPLEGNVTITLFNSIGQKVKQIFNGNVTAGLNSFNYNAGDLSSGVYLCQLRFMNQIVSKKLQLIK